VWHASRTAIDLDLDRPVLLLVTVSVHRCHRCRHFFRAQPPFLRPDAVYTNRVVATAVPSVYADGMAFGRVAARLARDFWVRPSEATTRGWCRAHAAGPEVAAAAEDYQRWGVEAFSGVLCIDEVYQGRLALLLAVDPAAPDGDRLVGDQLVHGPEHLSERERGHLDPLLRSPVGEPLRVARAFLDDWFLLWRDEAGCKRPPAAARARYDRWRSDPGYRALVPLRRVQDRLDAARFAQLSHFLRQPEWEATSNGAERLGRLFRHRQAPHFRLRSPRAIEGAVTVWACQRKPAALEPAAGAGGAQPSRAARGRKCRRPEETGAMAA
jgi:hypothetical protein